MPLNLAGSADVDRPDGTDRVRNVVTGSYPFGAAILPDGRTGLVSNEAAGTLSVVDLRKGVKLRDITVGPPLSHPQGVVVDRAGRRAYVALSALDEVVVVDLRRRRVERTISVGRSAGLGTMPVALALSPDGARLFVAESGADEIAVIRLPSPRTRPRARVDAARAHPDGRRPPGRGRPPRPGRPRGAAPVRRRPRRRRRRQPDRPCPDEAPSTPSSGPSTRLAPTTDVFSLDQRDHVPPRHGPRPRGADAAAVGRDASSGSPPGRTRQIHPRDAQAAPAGTPLRADGPIKHVFFVVRENRTYDQLLGDLGRGNSDPHLVVFGKNVTPNLHALVTRFPLLDHVFANSEASIQGHFWTAAASVPDYVDRNWVQEYAGRGRPNDFGVYAVTFPGNGFLFNQAERQHISYFNYGEAIAGDEPDVRDRDRTPEVLAEEKLRGRQLRPRSRASRPAAPTPTT